VKASGYLSSLSIPKSGPVYFQHFIDVLAFVILDLDLDLEDCRKIPSLSMTITTSRGETIMKCIFKIQQ